MSDESEIERLMLAAQNAAMPLSGEPQCVTTWRDAHEDGDWNAQIASKDRLLAYGSGLTVVQALRNLRNALRAELVRRRDEHNAAIAMLESE